MEQTPAGIVLRLWRYPVKSLLGECRESLDFDTRGVVGDRLFAVRDGQGKFGSGKTTRRFVRLDGLFGLSAAYDGPVPVITFPDRRAMRADDPRIHAALSAALGEPVTLAQEADLSHLDAGPVHVVTTASLKWLKGLLPDAHVDERRFRPNVVIDVAGQEQMEQRWLGQMLTVGEVRLRVRVPTKRCVMVTLAQSELPADPLILRRIADDAAVQFGIYADVLVPGCVRTRDVVTIGE
jgi:uncharacterized protein YcbX